MKKKFRVLGALLAGLMAVTAVPEIADQPVFTVVSEAASKLAAPKNVKVSLTDTTVKITWSKVKKASGYRVYMYNSKTGKYAKKKDVTGTSCKLTGLKAGTDYKIKIVTLKKSNGKKVEQNATNGQRFTTKLAAPKNFKATLSTSSVKLTWSKVKGAAGYRILLYDSVTKQYKTYKNITGTKFTFNNLPNGTYKFKVAALVKKNGKLKQQVESGVKTVKMTKSNVQTKPKEHVSGYKYGTKKYAIKHDISYMRSINTDFIGWLTIKDTPIDIPVVQATDNKFYLTHDFYGAYDPTKVGTTFADYHIKVTKNSRPENLIIYGHNIRTGVGLAKITNYYPLRYGSLKFYTTHPTFTYESAFGGEKTYVVFAGMFVNTDTKHGDVFPYHKYQNFKNDSEFYKYFQEVFDRSVFYNPALNIKRGDKFLTLSTCFYPFGDQVDTRFVLFARELRQGESAKINVSKAYTNSSPKYFTYWYKANGGKWAGRKWPTSLINGYAAWAKKNS